MKIRPGNRLFNGGEALPHYEVIELTGDGMPFQVRFAFSVAVHDEETMPSMNYMYVNVHNLEEDTLTAAGVPAEVIIEIIND